MPLIEGIGDEVTLILGGFLLCIILMFAWLSTHTADIPLLREVGVIVVELSQRRNRTQNAASEEQLVRDDTDASITRDDTDASIERGVTSTNNERQQYDVDQRTGVPQLITRSSSGNNNIAAEVHTSATPSLDESAGLPRTVGVSISSDQGPEHAETTSSTPDQAAVTSASQIFRHKTGDQTSSDNLRESETLVPKASVVVDDNKGFAYPTEEEVRQRRVQYFQANKSTDGINAETHSSPDDSKPSGLSELPTSDSDHARHVRDNLHNTAIAAQEDVESTSRIYHQASAPIVDSSSIAINSTEEDISDSQTISGQEETTPSSKIRVKLKYMNETQRLVYAEPLDTIGDFRRTHFQAELQDNKWVRFIYNGQDLRDDDRTLQSCNIGDNCTMHCLITAQTQPNPPHVAAVEEDEDSFMGAIMYPLFIIIILIVWYFRFTYSEYFSTLCTFCLIGITSLIAFSIFAPVWMLYDNLPPRRRFGPNTPPLPGIWQYFSAMSTVCLIGITFLLALSYISSLRTSDRIPLQRRLGPNTPPSPEVRLQDEHQHVD